MHSPEAGSTRRILGTEWRLVRQVSWGGRALGNGVLSQGALPVPVDEGVHLVSAGGGWRAPPCALGRASTWQLPTAAAAKCHTPASSERWKGLCHPSGGQKSNVRLSSGL